MYVLYVAFLFWPSIHGLGDVSAMRFWALGPAFQAHMIGDT